MEIALDKTYMDVEKLIYKIVWRFKIRYGGEIDELKAEANYLFLLSCQTYEESKSAFSTWLSWCIWHGLLDWLNEENKHTKLSINDTTNDGQTYEELLKNEFQKPFYLFELIEDLPNDAAFIIKLLFNPTKRFREEVLSRGTKPKFILIGLRYYLYEDLEWLKKEISESIGDIRIILNDPII